MSNTTLLDKLEQMHILTEIWEPGARESRMPVRRTGELEVSESLHCLRGGGARDLRELVVLAGGRLVNTARVAEVVVGEFCHVGDSTSPHFVTDHWLLDSVQHHSVRPFLDYPLT